jgi:N-acylneuraminate cytidylyltransferase
MDAAINCSYIDKVYISTDSDIIKEKILQYQYINYKNENANKLECIDRSEETASDTASTESAMLEFAHNYDFKKIILIQATSPLLTTQDLEGGIRIYLDGNYDSLLSVVRQKRFIWQENGQEVKPLNYDPFNRPRRQEFDGFIVENGAFYITTKELLLQSRCRISGKIGYYEMNDDSYYEIDEPSDWLIVEHLLKRQTNKQDLKDKLSNIKMLLMDSDGVLTDGGMYYSENGDELKKFNTKDGMAIELLKSKGIKVGIITGEDRELVRKRAEKLRVDELYMGIKNKLAVLEKIREKYNLAYSEIAYIGDDINDIDVIKKVGFGCSVSDGMNCVKEVAHYVTSAKGGQGAVREVVELIMGCSNPF